MLTINTHKLTVSNGRLKIKEKQNSIKTYPIERNIVKQRVLFMH